MTMRGAPRSIELGHRRLARSAPGRSRAARRTGVRALLRSRAGLPPRPRTPIVREGRGAARVAELANRVQNALDEGRILILGGQILLGFEYRAFFEHGFESLPEWARAAK